MKKKEKPENQKEEKTKSPQRKSREKKPAPMLRFSPTAWAKLLHFRDHGESEIGGFGITKADDLLLVGDFATVKQEVSVASIAFDDNAVADLFDSQVDAGRRPEQFARIWLHTHPGDSPQPSGTDEETFSRVFGSCDWTVMFVLARNGKSYARLHFNTGPGGQILIPVDVDFSEPFGPSNQKAWEEEYKANIKALAWPEMQLFGARTDPARTDYSAVSVPEDWIEELEAMEPEERQQILSELAGRPDLWQESEVFDEF